MNRDPPDNANTPLNTLRIWQQNLNKSLLSQLDLLQTAGTNDFELIILQEPYFDHLKLTRANSHWSVIYPSRHHDRPETSRAAILVSTRLSTNSWTQIPIDSPDITAIQLENEDYTLRIFNIYNDGEHSRNLADLENIIRTHTAGIETIKPMHMIWMGDFNRHHPMWDETRNHHLFTSGNLDAAQKLLDLLANYDMRMVLPHGIPTLEATGTKNFTRPDNVFCNEDYADHFLICTTDPGRRPPTTDHLPILATIDMRSTTAANKPRLNYKATDWPVLQTAMEEALQGLPAPRRIRTVNEFHTKVKTLMSTIENIVAQNVPTTKATPHSKRWWSKELDQWRKATRKLANKSHSRRANRQDPIHELYRRARNDYSEQLRKAKKEHWYTWLKDISETSVWTVNRFVTGPASDGGRARIPALKVKDEWGQTTEVQDNEGKSKELYKSFFHKAPADTNLEDDYNYPAPCTPFRNITNSQIDRAISKLAQYKAPGPNGVSNAVLTHCRELITPHLGPIFRATFTLKVYPAEWKTSRTVVLRKPGKPDYTNAKAYRPIALLDTISKVLSTCVAEDLTYIAETHKLLPQNHFGGRPGRTATDSLHLVTKFIKDSWRKKKVVTGLFLDVTGAYPAVVISKLIHDMRKRAIPVQYTNWLKEKYIYRRTTLCFDDYESGQFDVENGADQGCPLAHLIYQFYNADLIEADTERPNELKVGFVDDAAFLAAGETFEQTNEVVTNMMTREGGALEWAESHNSTFDIVKTGLVGFTRKRDEDPNKPNKTINQKRLPITILGREITPKQAHLFLGLIVDEELRFKEQAARALAKGMTWAAQFRRLSKTAQGMGGKFTRQLFLSVAIPRMLYAVDIFCTPIRGQKGTAKQAKGSLGMARKMATVQRMAALQITGGMKSSPTDMLNAHADLMPFQLLINKLCVRSALRLATIPKTHPLFKHVRSAANRHIGRHRSPLHSLMQAFNIKPDTMEKIEPVRHNPKWKISFKTHIAASKDDAVEEEANNNLDTRVYSDGSGIDGGIGASAVLYRRNKPTRSLKYYLGSAEHHTVYEGELVGIMLATELLRTESGITEAFIGVDSQAAIRATVGFRSNQGHYLADMIHDQIKKIQKKERRKRQGAGKIELEIRWTPGHRDLPGNEAADHEAKKAARGETSELTKLPTALRRRGKPLPFSKSAIKQSFNRNLDAEAKELLTRSPRYARISEIDKSLAAGKFRVLTETLSRGQASLLFQLRTGHVPLNKHLHRIGAVDSPKCNACRGAEETVIHYLLKCPALTRHRQTMNKELGLGARTLGTLLNNEKALPYLFDFVGATGRFRETFGKTGMDGTV